MPEGPEIRRATEGVARALVGRRLEHVAFGLPRLAAFEEQFIARLESREFRGRALAAVLLDTGFVAGLGNDLRTEIPWRSG